MIFSILFPKKKNLIYIFILIGSCKTATIYPIYGPIFHVTKETIGHRPTMEDAHHNITNGNFGPKSVPERIKSPHAFFYGIYDGHAGSNASNFCAENLHTFIAMDRYFETVPEKSVYNSFFKTHEAYKGQDPNRQPTDGTTAVIALIKNNRLFVANTGDARAVLCVNNQAKRLSFDHKPDEPSERGRIDRILRETRNRSHEIITREVAQYTILEGVCPQTGRQKSVVKQCLISRIPDQNQRRFLSLSRAIGDFGFYPLITPEPFISKTELTGREQFLILACDGFWDVITDQAAVNLVLYNLAKLKTARNDQVNQILEDICTLLVRTALRLESSDNISVTIIFFPAAVDALDYEPTKTLGFLQLNDAAPLTSHSISIKNLTNPAKKHPIQKVTIAPKNSKYLALKYIISKK